MTEYCSNASHSGNPELIDNYNRKLNYLRISVTDKCNFKCSYCVGHTPSPKLKHSEILRYEEILRIVKIGVRHGITKVRVTGGEPLIKKGIYNFLEKLTAIKGLSDVSLTTNGMLLGENLTRIKNAGIKRLNISIDSLNKEKFHRITGVDGFDTVWKNILQAHEMGFSLIKINTVAIHGLNDDELVDFARLSFLYPFHFRFIEYMPIGTPELKVTQQLLTPEIKNRLAALGPLTPVKKDKHDGPAVRFKYPESKGEVGFISPVSNHFCNSCNRLRLTASGKIRPCLLSNKSIDISGPMRSGCPDDELHHLFRLAVMGKNEKHHLEQNGNQAVEITDPMSSIGG